MKIIAILLFIFGIIELHSTFNNTLKDNLMKFLEQNYLTLPVSKEKILNLSRIVTGTVGVAMIIAGIFIFIL